MVSNTTNINIPDKYYEPKLQQICNICKHLMTFI